MRVEAWCCERCGRLVPVGLGPDEDEPPLDWLVVNITRVGFVPDDERLFCSDQCASLGLRPEKQAKPKATPPKKAKKAVAGSGVPFDLPYTCPECARGFKRAQALGSHRQRTHGVAGRGRQKG